MSVMLTMIYHICYITPISSAFRYMMMINDDKYYDDDEQRLVCWPWHVISPPSPQESDIRELSRGILGFWMSDAFTRWQVMLMIHDFVYKISISVIAPYILKFSVLFVSNIHRLGLQSRRAAKLWSKIKTVDDITSLYTNERMQFWYDYESWNIKTSCILGRYKVYTIGLLCLVWSCWTCCDPHVIFKQWGGGPVYNV